MPTQTTMTPEPVDVLSLDRLDDHPALIDMVQERHALARQVVDLQHDIQDLDRRISAAHTRARDVAYDLELVDKGILTSADMALGPSVNVAPLEEQRRAALAEVQQLREALADSEYRLNREQRRVRQEVQSALAGLMADLARQVAIKLFEAVPAAKELGAIAAQGKRLLGTVQIDPLLRLGDIQLMAEKCNRAWARLNAQGNTAAAD